MSNTATACGKIILSGEYAVVFGYPGIAIPAPVSLTAIFQQTQKHPMEIIWPEVEATGWIPYLKKIIDLCIERGSPYAGTLTIENSIPLGRGMGSSTALVITISKCLLGQDHSLFPLPAGEGKGEGYVKKIALSIEDTLNPGGSGLDFEVIWNECPILFRKGEPSKPLTVTINQLIGTPHQFLLIDTGKPDQTTPALVSGVRSRSSDSRIAAALEAIGNCTERLLSGESPLTVFPDHHRAQVALGVVPKKVQTLIQEIEKIGGAAKVIGAGARSGGGGVVLAYGPIDKLRHLPNIFKHPINQTAVHLFTRGDPREHQPTLQL